MSVFRAAKQSTPVSVTKSLSELRLTHAHLAEKHGSTLALLQQREKDLAEADLRLVHEQTVIDKLKAELELVKGKASRQEHLAELAERDVNYLKAMVVSLSAHPNLFSA